MNILLGVTTCNQLEYTKILIESYNKLDVKYDLLVVDDFSKDDTLKYLDSQHIKYIKKNEPQGLTHSWNELYKYFKFNDYDALLFLNNDISISNNSIEPLLRGLECNELVCPMSTLKGVGHNPPQSITNYYVNIPFDVNNYNNYQNTQDFILKSNIKEQYIDMNNKFNGFAFAVSKKIANAEYSKDVLFNPNNLNVGQESDLMSRLFKCNYRPVLCNKSFLFHYKGVTLYNNEDTKRNPNKRNNLNYYH